MKSPQRLGLITAAAALVADQACKNLFLYGLGFAGMRPYERVDVLPFFDLVMVWNRGVSYGLLQAEGTLGTLLLTLFSLAAVAGLTWWLFKAEHKTLAIGIGLIIGGALGNVIDRMLYGAVADFFHFYAWGRDWYVFNLADAAITIGVVMLLADALIRPDAKASERSREPVIRKE
jgi:signal peptidase II